MFGPDFLDFQFSNRKKSGRKMFSLKIFAIFNIHAKNFPAKKDAVFDSTPGQYCRIYNRDGSCGAGAVRFLNVLARFFWIFPDFAAIFPKIFGANTVQCKNSRHETVHAAKKDRASWTTSLG
jgi:hypothetical protein